MMKTRIAALALITIPMFACKSKEKTPATSDKPVEAKAAAPKNEPPLELTDTVDVGAAITDADDTNYAGLKVNAPAGAKAETGMPGVVIRIGERAAFEITTAYEPGYVAKKKAEAQKDELDQLVTLHIDTPEAILWETKSKLGGDNNFHFAAEVKAGDKAYKCANSGWGNFTKVQAEALLKTCQSLTK